MNDYVDPTQSEAYQYQQQHENVVYQGDPTLPPPGHEREEELKRREDNLQAQMENQPEQYSINPKHMEVDREIRYQLEHDLLSIPNKQPGYVYRWVQCQYPSSSPSLMVQKELVRRVWINGQSVSAWEIVTGQHPEASGFTPTAENTIRIGDTLLMRCRQEVYELIEEERRKTTAAQNYATDAGMMQYADEVTRQGYPVDAGHKAYNKYFNNANQSLREAETNLDQMIRNGTLPGLPVPHR